VIAVIARHRNEIGKAKTPTTEARRHGEKPLGWEKKNQQQIRRLSARNDKSKSNINLRRRKAGKHGEDHRHLGRE
jgi:hypothetical protein